VALRKDLGKFQKHIEDMDLVDFKVRILNGGTGATTRVLVESRDGKGERWFTVGVSPNIVEASFQALLDSITYKLVRDGVAA
jgi:2-isopropylmalate synthase